MFINIAKLQIILNADNTFEFFVDDRTRKIYFGKISKTQDVRESDNYTKVTTTTKYENIHELFDYRTDISIFDVLDIFHNFYGGRVFAIKYDGITVQFGNPKFRDHFIPLNNIVVTVRPSYDYNDDTVVFKHQDRYTFANNENKLHYYENINEIFNIVLNDQL